MDGRQLVYAILPFVVLVALGAGFVLVFRYRGRPGFGPIRRTSAGPAPSAGASDRADRPWWGNPWLWVGIAAVFLVLGVFVWPGLFGGVILFLPFVWVSRPRPPEMDPRTNGHSRRGDSLGSG